MNRAFTCWADFFAMGGYAFYVWLAVVLTAIPLLVLVVHTVWQHRVILKEAERQRAREQRIRAARQIEGM